MVEKRKNSPAAVAREIVKAKEQVREAESKIIEVKADPTSALTGVILRSAGISLGTWLVSKGYIDDPETIGGAVLALGTVAYGLFRTYREKQEKKALADSAPIGRVV